MAIVIRSNVKATRSIGNVHQYHGPMDFTTVLDFERGIYSVGGDDARLEDVVSLQRLTPADYRGLDGVWRTAAPNEPRIHWLDSGRNGLLLEDSSDNLYLGAVAPTKTVAVTLFGGGPSRLTLRVWGSGSATISTSEPTVAETQSRTALANSPAELFFATGQRTIDVTITVTGSVSRVFLENSPSRGWSGLKTPPPAGTDSRAADYASMAEAVFSQVRNSAGTLVFAYTTLPALIQGLPGSGDWFSLPSTGAITSGVHVVSNDRTRLLPSVRGIDGGNYGLSNMPMADTPSRTFAMAWDGGGTTVRMANNGVVHEQSSAVFPPFTGLVMSGHTSGTAYRGAVNAVLTQFVHYDRALSPSELQAATTSWL